MGFKACGNVW